MSDDVAMLRKEGQDPKADFIRFNNQARQGNTKSCQRQSRPIMNNKKQELIQQSNNRNLRPN